MAGACLASSKDIRARCRGEKRVWYSEGCPSKIGIVAVVVLGLYILAYAPGMGTVPWILNSEIYPNSFRGLGGGIAAVANWSANLIVSESFLSMVHSMGASGTFLFFAGASFIGLVVMYFLVPETKGLHFEQVEDLLRRGFMPYPFNNKITKDDTSATTHSKHKG